MQISCDISSAAITCCLQWQFEAMQVFFRTSWSCIQISSSRWSTCDSIFCKIWRTAMSLGKLFAWACSRWALPLYLLFRSGQCALRMVLLGCLRRFLPVLQGTQRVQTAYSTIDTDAQAYVMSMLELHHESSQLRDNLRRQHRIWMDFYATIFRVGHFLHLTICCVPWLLCLHGPYSVVLHDCKTEWLLTDLTATFHKLHLKSSILWLHII